MVYSARLATMYRMVTDFHGGWRPLQNNIFAIGNFSAAGPSFAYSLTVHSFHRRRDRVASLTNMPFAWRGHTKAPRHSGQAEP